MGPIENPTSPAQKAAGRRKASARRPRGAPRARPCLLKGCEQRFHPRRARQRYCSQRCREEARKWSRWKAQEKYRATATGRQKRKGQSRRYRELVKSRKPAEPEAVNGPARVITSKHFFRSFVRPAGLLREIRAPAAKSLTVLLFGGVPARAGARRRAGTTLATSAHLKPEILIRKRCAP